MKYLLQELKDKFLTYLLGALFLAFMPWMTGPYWINVLGIFIVTYIIQVIWMIVRTVWLTFR